MNLPAFRSPQLATLADKVPAGDEWLFEMKFDGYRCQAAIAGDQVTLYTRRGHDWSQQFRFVVPPLRKLTKGTLLIDGEICAIDAQSRTNFSLLKTSFATGAPLVFYVFDLLEQDGADIARLPQLERKERLEEVVGPQPLTSPLQFSHHVQGHGDQVFHAMCEGGHEGVVAKRADAPYRAGDRSTAWIKVKCTKRQEFVIVGWRAPEEGGEGMRALILATYEDGKLVHRGRVGTGFTEKERGELYRKLKPLQIDLSPLAKTPRDLIKLARWVKPVLVAEVTYAEITPDGSLRHPSFQGLREDKEVKTIVLERPVDET
jgi:bifunctional non-homologous end joining protein LigD